MNGKLVNRCGGKSRGCKVVYLPFGSAANNIVGGYFGRFFGVHSLSNGGQPTWKVVRWDSDEDAGVDCKAVG